MTEKGLTTLLIELRRMVLDPDVSKDQLLPIIDKMKDAYTKITDDFLALISEIKPGQYSEIQKVLEKYKQEIAETWNKG